MIAPALRSAGPAEFALKAAAPLPTCVCAASSVDRHGSVFVYALKDLENAGIPARLILTGGSPREVESRVRHLAERLDVSDRVHIVHDSNAFTLSRVYWFSQYALGVAELDESGEWMRAAVAHGCIPIRYSGGYAAFFDEAERIIRATYNNPDAYAVMYKKTAATLLT